MSLGWHWWTLLAVAACLTPASAEERDSRTAAAQLRFEPRFILESVASRLGVTLRPEVAVPTIHFASTTPLRQFQEAIEVQWRFRPEVVVNTYAIARNEIYLYDGADYYAQHGRTLDDSLAHEFAHYLQARYWNDDLSSESREAEAVAIQTWFRETYARHEAVAQRAAPARGAALCSVVPGNPGARAVRCHSSSRSGPG